jgi:hypothetical protein
MKVVWVLSEQHAERMMRDVIFVCSFLVDVSLRRVRRTRRTLRELRPDGKRILLITTIDKLYTF